MDDWLKWVAAAWGGAVLAAVAGPSLTGAARGALRSSADTHRGGARVHHREARSEVRPADARAVRKKKIGTVRGYQVYSVDGTAIRDRIDPDFIGGGNPSRYGYVPLGEIWIERGTPRGDLVPYALHEATEAELMKRDGLTYDQAHAQATDAEQRLRRSPARKKRLSREWFRGPSARGGRRKKEERRSSAEKGGGSSGGR